MKFFLIIFLTMFTSIGLIGCINQEKEIEEEYFTVTFFDKDNNVIKTEDVLKGFDATPPTISEIDGYVFMRFDQSYKNITNDLEIYPLYYQTYISYIDQLDIAIITPITTIIDNIPKNNPTRTFSDIFEGGFRLENQINYYTQENKVDRNHYGFEVAVDKDGLVIEKNTLVEIPDDGFVLSGHSNTATLLSNAIDIGDLVEYDSSTKTAYLYRDATNSKLIALNIEINTAIDKINLALNNYKALNYILINELLNEGIDYYNDLVNSYDEETYENAKQNLLEIYFLLIEARPVQTNAVWHYPSRSGLYREGNNLEISELIDEYDRIGINRIYLNTNFNGGSVYKSDYLVQQMTAYNNYEGYKDYLEAFIDIAHSRDIEVYAWTNTLIAGDGRNNPLYSDKGWILEGYNGEDNFNGMYFIDVSNENAQTFLNNVFKELASNYKLDGIEFDFIRYPSGNIHTKSGVISASEVINDGGYNEGFINKFKEAHNFNGDLKKAIRTDVALREQWLNFKMNLLTNFVKDLTNTIRQANEDVKISAAVMPSISTAKNVYRQDWDTWIENNYLDGLEPMIYSGDTAYVTNALLNMTETVNNRAEITVGLYPEDGHADVSVIAEQIASLVDVYHVGVSRFSSRTIFAHKYLKEAMVHLRRENRTQSNDSKSLIFHSYISDLTEKINNYYQYVIDIEVIKSYLNNIIIDEVSDYNEIIKKLYDEINLLDNEIIRKRLLITNFQMELLLNS